MKSTLTDTPDNPPEPRLVSMFAYDGAEVLDITGVLDVFALANLIHMNSGGKEPLYRIKVAAETKDAVVVTSGGIRLLADDSWSAGFCADTLLVAGGPEPEKAPDQLVECLRLAVPSVRRVGSICTGAFILARAGLLEGRRATTHWNWADQLRRLYPQIDVQEDSIFIKDGPVYTSAGITAGIDLALALLEEDFDRAMALNVARMMVLYFKRPGGQSQFSTRLVTQFQEGGPLAPTIQWIRDNYQRDLRNETLAEHAAMSLRNFSRVFNRETGMTPADFVKRIRLEAAVRFIEETDWTMDTIARECGFQSGEHFRLTFTRRFGITIGQYRYRFRSGGK
ncbi:MAG TPA: GlxA family transcriptional regulator [Negativicutes bacterium]